VTCMSAAEAAQFAQRWLPAWTGNDPQRLAAFYSDDALYVDPGIPAGARGKADLLAYSHAHSLVVKQEEPVLHNLDAIAAWLARPQAETIVCSDFLDAWNLFGDIARSCPQYSVGFAARDRRESR